MLHWYNETLKKIRYCGYLYTSTFIQFYNQMDKKQYVLKVLDMLKDSMPLARWFMVLIQNTDVDDEILDTLIHAFQESLKDIQDEELKKKLEKWKTFLEMLKQKEIQSQNLDQEDIKHLDELLANM
jgi:acetolactate synthase small subunit